MKYVIRFVAVLGLSVVMGVSVTHFLNREELVQEPLMTQTELAEATNLKMQADYGKLPLHFEPNVGQSADNVDFISRGKGYALFLTDGEAVLALSRSSKEQVQADVIRIQLQGAQASPVVFGVQLLSGKSNYMLGNDPAKWHTDVPHYGKVKYDAVYPGIDLVYYGTEQRQLEHDFVVSPGADPDQIRFSVKGADNLVLDDDGNLIASTEGGDVVLQAPVTYQDIAGERVSVESRYALLGDVVGFELAAYDTDHTVVIDPVLSYSTYLGSSATDIGYAIAVDGSGNAYVTGQTLASGFPTQSPFDGTHNGTNDGFVSKLNSSGSALIYSTYLGGSGLDISQGIAIDGSGNAYIAGYTNSSNFPTQSPYDGTYSGGNDAFVSVLNSSGSALVYSTYLGGNSGDYGYAIAVDGSGNAYITGFTESSGSFPLVSPYDGTYNGSNDAYVAVFNSTGSALIYSTFLGGSGSDKGYGIAVDNAGKAYVTGQTASTNFPTSGSALQGVNNGGDDAFVFGLNNTGSALVYSTYLGGSGSDKGFGIAINAVGNAFVVGNTQSSDFPLQSPFDGALSGSSDAFVSMVVANGTSLVYSTYLGGSSTDDGYGIAVDNLDKAYVTGSTASTDFPMQSAIDGTHNGGDDVYVSVFNNLGSALVYSSYLGGSGNDSGNGIAVLNANDVYVAGQTASTDFTVQSAFDATHNGGTDAFVSKMTLKTFVNQASAFGVDDSDAGLGVAWGDYDGDGDQDLYVSTGGTTNKLYRNDGTSFGEIASTAGVRPASGASTGTSWVDFDNDGDLDLLVVMNSANDKLYRNDGASFTDVGTTQGLTASASPKYSASWLDYDRDGDADVYITVYGGNNLLYRNDNGSFAEVGSGAGVAHSGFSEGVATGDFNNDGYTDIYALVSGASNALYQNDTAGGFTDVTGAQGVSGGGGSTISGSFADYDNDGYLDLFVGSNGGSDVLYRNTGTSFSDQTVAAGVSNSGATINSAWAHYDNDGDLDLHVGEGSATPDKLWQNNGVGVFANVAGTEGSGNTGNVRGMAWSDFDNDGDLDLYIGITTANNVFYVNAGNNNQYLQVNLSGTLSNRFGFGSAITALAGGIRQTRYVDGGYGWNSQSSTPVEFGFGATTTIDSLIVQWSSGQVWDTTNVSTNQFLTVYEAQPLIEIPDTIAAYADTINVPVRITNGATLDIVAAELKIAYDKTIVTPGNPDKTEIVGTLVAAGWSVEENVLPGSGNIDTLTVAMSTASDTIDADGTLIYLVLYTADVRHPASTALELTHVLLNDGTPTSLKQDGSLALTGTNGTIVASPDSINPADVVTVTVTDVDFDVDVGTAEQVSATAVSKLYGDTENVILTETGVNTGVFTGTLNTSFSLVADPSQNGTLGTVAGDSICVSFLDSLDIAGGSVTRVDTVEVIGGVDGVVVASYVVQALDGRTGIRDTVRVEVADADLDTDVGVAEQVSATITNAISGEVEGVTLIETGVNTGVFQVRVPTIEGASGTNNNGELSLASWDTLNVVYNDALSSQGGANAVQEITRVVNLFGDVRVNDNVQAFDAARLLAISVGLITANTQTTLVGDVDGNGAIQAFDASRVLQYVVRLIDRFGVQTDFTADPKNHPFEKPVPLGNVIALGNLEAQGDGTFLLPVSLGEREGILSGTLTLGVDAGIEVVDVDLANDYGSFMVAHNQTREGLKVAFAGSQSELSGSGNVLMLKVRGVEGSPLRLSLDHVVLNGQTLTPQVNIEAMEEVITQAPELITELHQNLPNPFNPQTTIKYALAEASQVQMVIYSVTGQRIRTLVSEFQDSGSYQVVWDGKDALGRDVSSGVYLMRMQATGFTQTKKMLLLR